MLGATREPARADAYSAMERKDEMTPGLSADARASRSWLQVLRTESRDRPTHSTRSQNTLAPTAEKAVPLVKEMRSVTVRRGMPGAWSTASVRRKRRQKSPFLSEVWGSTFVTVAE